MVSYSYKLLFKPHYEEGDWWNMQRRSLLLFIDLLYSMAGMKDSSLFSNKEGERSLTPTNCCLNPKRSREIGRIFKDDLYWSFLIFSILWLECRTARNSLTMRVRGLTPTVAV